MTEENNNFPDLNIHLILKALETRTEITLIPRRSHAIKGIPVNYDKNTYRIYLDTGTSIETVLLREVGHFVFPRELFDEINNGEFSFSPKQQAEEINKIRREKAKK